MTKIERIIPKPIKLPSCQASTGDFATRPGSGCSNLARIKIDGKELCIRHAQQLALEILMGEKP